MISVIAINRPNLPDRPHRRHLRADTRACAPQREARAPRALRIAGIVVGVAAALLATATLGAQQPAQQGGEPASDAALANAQSAAQGADPSPRRAASPAPAAPSSAGDGAYTVARPTVIRTAPDAAPVGELRAGAGVEVIGHDRGWVRVRTEAWVPASEIVPADTAYRAALSAADVRADPDGTRGKVVQWTVQFIALQTADPLRRGLAPDEPYVLARGPGRENALLYLVVPPSLLGTARALSPLDSVAVTARVRDGRSEPVGVPILDLQALRRLQ
jgi:hypothetical protein